jgi:hypothetical protein
LESIHTIFQPSSFDVAQETRCTQLVFLIAGNSVEEINDFTRKRYVHPDPNQRIATAYLLSVPHSEIESESLKVLLDDPHYSVRLTAWYTACTRISSYSKPLGLKEREAAELFIGKFTQSTKELRQAFLSFLSYSPESVQNKACAQLIPLMENVAHIQYLTELVCTLRRFSFDLLEICKEFLSSLGVSFKMFSKCDLDFPDITVEKQTDLGGKVHLRIRQVFNLADRKSNSG